MVALIPIDKYCEQLLKDDPSIQPEEMLHYLHLAGYGREESVLKVHGLFSDLTVDEMCRIIVNEYNNPLIAKDALKDLLIKCGYDEASADAAITKYYPRSLGYVLMLDDSASMRSASAIIKIDAKAFVDCSRTGDQFGVNGFGVDAAWIYPTGDAPAPAAVTEGRDEIKAAEAEIDKLKTNGSLTNIGAAVVLSNAMEEQMDTDIKAYVLISDGAANTGPNPALGLNNEPPIYIAGLGPWMKESYFTAMLAKNEKSKFYNSPNAVDMMMIFNQILADSSQSLLLLNHMEACQGTNYSVQEFTICGKGNRSLISVVWSDKKYRYTPGYPSGNQINLVLIDPDNHSTSIQPQIVDDGFCIYDLCNAKPGTWKILSQYTLTDTVSATSGVIQTDMPIIPEIAGTQSIKMGENPEFILRIAGASMLNDLSVSAIYSRPAVDFRNVMQANHWHDVPESGFDMKDNPLFPRMQSFALLERCETDMFRGNMGICENPGIYNAFLTIKGSYKDGVPFRCNKMHSVIVE